MYTNNGYYTGIYIIENLYQKGILMQWLYKYLFKKYTKYLLSSYPREMATSINVNSPLRIYNNFDNTLYDIFIAASPVSLTADGRTDDLTAILKIIDKAEMVNLCKFVQVCTSLCKFLQVCTNL